MTLSHRAHRVPKWGAMTMDFKLPKAVRRPRHAAWKRAIGSDFEFYMDADGLPQLDPRNAA